MRQRWCFPHPQACRCLHPPARQLIHHVLDRPGRGGIVEGGEGGAGGHKLELGARVTFIVSPPGVALGSQAQKGGVESHFGADSSWRFEW